MTADFFIVCTYSGFRHIVAEATAAKAAHYIVNYRRTRAEVITDETPA